MVEKKWRQYNVLNYTCYHSKTTIYTKTIEKN